jgi:hypothetical protein
VPIKSLVARVRICRENVSSSSSSSVTEYVISGLFGLRGCWPIHLYLGRLRFLLPVEMHLCTNLGMSISVR